MIKHSAILLGVRLTLGAFTAAAQTPAPAPAKAVVQPAAPAPAKPAAAPAAAPVAAAATADEASKKADEAMKAERRARFDLRATEEGDKLNDAKKQIDTLTTQKVESDAKGTSEMAQQRQVPH